jgi:4-hydroxybutyrate dehydrogenase/sulfolactaldehyde 3-reductase
MSRRPLGFLGLGNMGGGMARWLLRQGWPVTVFDPLTQLVQACVREGAVAAASPRAVAERSEIVLSSLPTPQAVEEAVTGPEGILRGLRPGGIYIDLSTIDPATSRRMHTAVAAAGGRMLDCPVGRGPAEAASGRLLLMVGGEAALLEEVRELLATLGSPIHHCGPAGAGAAAKLVNNLVSCAINALNAEALVLAAKAGVDLPVMVEIMKGTAADNRHLAITAEPRVLDGIFEPRFRLALAEKDLRLAVQLGLELGVPTALGEAAHRLHQVARAQGWGEEDQGAVIRAIEAVAGIAARRR